MGAIYSNSRSNRTRQSNNFSGGINTGFPAVSIADNQSTDEVGWDTDQFPVRAVRKGRTSYGTSGGGVTYLLANYGNTHLVRAVGTALQYNSTGTTWTAITGTFTAADWDYTNFNDKLILTNGTDEVKVWNGSALSDLNAADAPQGKYITNDTNRVWIALGDTLYWSAFLDETDWTTAEDSGSVQYYTPRGGDITAIKRYYDRITLFKKDSMAEIQGRSFFNFQLVEISNDIGCVSFKTLVEVGDTLFWLGQNDVYAYSGGKPRPIGQRIRSYLNDINTTHLSKCCAGTDGLRYYLCLVTGANTEPNIRFVYDPRYDVWLINALSEDFRYWAQLNNVTYVGDDAGQTFQAFDGTDDDGTAITWSITSKAFNDGLPEAESEYKELHLQGYFPSGSTVSASVNTDERDGTFTSVTFDPSTAASKYQNRNVIVPLDTVEHTHYFRYKLNGTGYVEIDEVQRYFKQLRVQQ